MREVTLYQIQAERMIAGDFVELHSYEHPNKILRFSRDEAMVPLERDVKVECVPVHCITKCEPVLGYPSERMVMETYIAIEPKLRQILEAPFVAEMRTAVEAEREQRIVFNAQPWWRRAWQAARRGV